MNTVLLRSLCVLEVVINWKCQEGSCSNVIRSVNRKYRIEILDDWLSGWHLKYGLFYFQVDILNMDSQNSKNLCLQISRVFSWQTVVPISVRKLEISQGLCRCVVMCNRLPKLWDSNNNVRPSFCLSLELNIVKRNVWWILECSSKNFILF
jgi:hypothetical protein